MEFKEITEIVKSVLDGTMEETQVINLDVDGEKVSEYDVEQYLNFDDNTAALNKTVKSVIERTYSKKKVNMLKRLYAYRCQICGQNVGEEHGVNIAEAHHIKYFSKSVDNSSDNLLILCPNHHSLIHVLNPKFDYDELQYIYPDGKTDKIILDLHLTHGKEENKMTISEQIKVLCVRQKISLAELARRLGTTPQNFNAKLKRESFTVAELEDIAEAAGVTFERSFVLDDGDTV